MASAAPNGSQKTPVNGEIIVLDIAFPRFATREKVYRLSRRRKNVEWTEQTWLTKTGAREQKQIRTGCQAANPYRQLPYHHKRN